MIWALGGGLWAALLLLGAVRIHGVLAWVVCAPLVRACLRVQGWRGACAVGAIFGAGVAVGGNVPWVVDAGQRYFALPAWLAVLAAGFLGILCGTMFGALLGTGLWCAVHRSAGWAVIVVGAVWAAWESLTISVFPYYPWVALAATQTDLPVFLQSVSVFGQSGLTFATAAVGTAFGLAWETEGWRRRRLIAAGLTAMGLLAAFGDVRLTASTALESEACAISAIDAGIPSGQLPAQAVLERYETLSEQALVSRPAAIVWPESALPGYPEVDAVLQRRLRQLARDWGALLIAGGPRVTWDSDWQQRLFNSVYGIEATAPLRTYDKRTLVPFAEYWPVARSLRPEWLAADEVTPGDQPVLFPVGACRLGVLICFEADHPALAREAVRLGANALLIVSNDAHVPQQALRQEVAQARLRAVETGVPIVRAANHGTSVVIDRYGRVLAQGTAEVLNPRITPGVAAPAVHLSPTFLTLCWIASSVAAVMMLFRSAPAGTGRLR